MCADGGDEHIPGIRLHDGAACRKTVGRRAAGGGHNDAVSPAAERLDTVALHAEIDDPGHGPLGNAHVI